MEKDMKVINNEMNPEQVAEGGFLCFAGCAAACIILWEAFGAAYGTVGFFWG